MKSQKLIGIMDILIGLADIAMAVVDFHVGNYVWGIVLCFLALCVICAGILILTEGKL